MQEIDNNNNSPISLETVLDFILRIGLRSLNFMFAFNWLVCRTFNLSQISYKQAVSIMFMVSIFIVTPIRTSIQNKSKNDGLIGTLVVMAFELFLIFCVRCVIWN